MVTIVVNWLDSASLRAGSSGTARADGPRLPRALAGLVGR